MTTNYSVKNNPHLLRWNIWITTRLEQLLGPITEMLGNNTVGLSTMELSNLLGMGGIENDPNEVDLSMMQAPNQFSQDDNGYWKMQRQPGDPPKEDDNVSTGSGMSTSSRSRRRRARKPKGPSNYTPKSHGSPAMRNVVNRTNKTASTMARGGARVLHRGQQIVVPRGVSATVSARR